MIPGPEDSSRFGQNAQNPALKREGKKIAGLKAEIIFRGIINAKKYTLRLEISPECIFRNGKMHRVAGK